MCKTVLTLMGVLLSTAGAWAQSGQPGYSFLTSSQKPVAGPAVVRPTATSPPEPARLCDARLCSHSGQPRHALPRSHARPDGPDGTDGRPDGHADGRSDGRRSHELLIPMRARDRGYPGGALGPGLPPDPVSTFGTETHLGQWQLPARRPDPSAPRGPACDDRLRFRSPSRVLGQPGTQVLFGDQQYQYGPLSGVQVDLGVNLNDRLYLEGSVMYFGPQHTTAFYGSDANGSPFIGRPGSTRSSARTALT